MENSSAGKSGRTAGGTVKPQESQSHYNRKGAQGKAHHKPQVDLGKGLEHGSPLGAIGRSQSVRQQLLMEVAVLSSLPESWPLGAWVQWDRALDTRAPIRHSWQSCVPPRTKGSGGGNRTVVTLLPLGHPQAVQSSTPGSSASCWEHLDQCGLGPVGSHTQEADSRAGNLAATIVVFPLHFILCLGEAGPPGN